MEDRKLVEIEFNLRSLNESTRMSGKSAPNAQAG